MTAPTPAASPVLLALLERVVDYAGLFPPARLSMRDAVLAYADYRKSPDAWMLGRFVVPASRLEEFDEAGADVLPSHASASWALSALVGADIELDAHSIERFNTRHRDLGRGAVHIDTVELKATRADEVRAAAAVLDGFDTFVEVEVTEDPTPIISVIGDVGAKAKIRTGGLTPDAIPGPRHVLRFLRGCLDFEVGFKATAGLHHPLRAEYPLTYEPHAPRAVLYGFLNVFLTAALLRAGLDDSAALVLLDERDPAAIQWEGDRIAWREFSVDVASVRETRHAAAAFGSCSFREPVDELRRLGVL